MATRTVGWAPWTALGPLVLPAACPTWGGKKNWKSLCIQTLGLIGPSKLLLGEDFVMPSHNPKL